MPHFRSWILVTAALVLTPSEAPGDAHREVAVCAAMADGIARLQCYDNLAQKRGATRELTRLKAAGQWKVREDVSKIDDTKSVLVYVDATQPIAGRFGRTAHPTLMLRCMQNSTSVIFHWKMFLSTQNLDVTYRVDRQPARTRSMSISTNHEAIGLWSGNESIPFIKALLGSSQLLVQLTPYGENTHTVAFPTVGLEPSLKSLRDACNWPASQGAEKEARRAEAPQLEYVGQIRAAVERNWIRPKAAPKGLQCTLRVSQIPDGSVINVQIVKSSGNVAFDNSCKDAVGQSSPLPLPKDPSLFARELTLIVAPVD